MVFGQTMLSLRMPFRKCRVFCVNEDGRGWKGLAEFRFQYFGWRWYNKYRCLILCLFRTRRVREQERDRLPDEHLCNHFQEIKLVIYWILLFNLLTAKTIKAFLMFTHYACNIIFIRIRFRMFNVHGFSFSFEILPIHRMMVNG